MRKRRVYLALLILAGATVVGLLLSWVIGPGEPRYGGHALSHWVLAYQTGTPPYPVSEIQRAILKVGTNGIPYLLEWVGFETPAWKSNVFRAANPILAQMNTAWKLDDEKHEARATGAAHALITLGPKAEGAIPQLTKLLNLPGSPPSAMLAANVLSCLGDGLPPLLAFVTNQQAAVFIRQHVVMMIGQRGSHGRLAVPTLLSLLADPNPAMGRSAMHALLRIDFRIWKIVKGIEPPPRRRDPGIFIPGLHPPGDAVDLD